MSSSRRSSTTSTRTRSSLFFPARKSSQLSSVSFIHAESEQPSAPPAGSAAAKLSPRLGTRHSQKKIEEDMDSRKSVLEASDDGLERTDSEITLTAPAAPQDDDDREARIEDNSQTPEAQDSRSDGDKVQASPNELKAEKNGVRKSRSWFTFRRQPSISTFAVVAEGSDAKSTSASVNELSSGSSAPHVSSERNDINTPQQELVQAPLVSAVPISIESPQSVNNRSGTASWFGSFSKTSAKAIQIQEAPTESDRGPACGLSPRNNANSLPASPESKATSGRSIWFTPQPQNVPRPPLEHVPSAPSSLDIKTPVQQEPPMVAAALPAPEMELVSAIREEVKLSALNPTSSRFAISAPLLGRPKVPLSDVGAIDKEVIQNETVVSSPVTENEINTERLPMEEPTRSEGPNIASEIMTEVKPTWWTYLGLAKPSTVDDPQAAGVPELQSIPAEPPSIANGQPQTEPTSGEEEDRNKQRGTNNLPAQPDEEARHNVGHAISITSDQSAHSAWYSPWGWYEWYYTSSVTSERPEETVAVKTEAELIKEAALSRAKTPENPPAPSSEQASDPPSSQAPMSAPDSSPEPINPILSSLTANPSGWTSFFTMRTGSLTTKTITEAGEREGGESMEVMEIDDFVDTSLCDAKDSHVKSLQGDSDSKTATTDLKQMDGLPRSPDITAQAPLTTIEDIKRKAVNKQLDTRSSSPTPSKKSTKNAKSNIPTAPAPTPANLVLPTFDDTFFTLPRSHPPPKSRSSASSAFRKTMGFVSSVLFAREEDEGTNRKGKERERRPDLEFFGKELPRAWKVLGEDPEHSPFSECKKVVVIGVHGWFPGYAMRTVLGEPTGTSKKFANMMALALRMFSEKYNVEFEKITKIPLEGEGKIKHRVDRLYQNLTANNEWMEALHTADVIFVATHSQGCIVSTHLISRLISDGHIRTARSNESNFVNVATSVASGMGAVSGVVARRAQRVCCLGLCGIHLGPLAYLQKSSLLMPYIQYFESEAAGELFEFQHTESSVSKDYFGTVQHVLDHGVKFVYIASLNDQVVPVYSGVFTSASHPLILRALYMDGDAYHSSDFLSNLLVLLLRIRNAGLSDGGLLAHLSEATAGSLNGVGHSTAYEEIATYTLAVEYLFLTNDGQEDARELVFEPFNARDALNDYEIPWALRDLIADERVVHLFSKEIAELRDAFGDWHPRTTILRDLKRKLEPIRRLKLPSRL